MTKTEFRLKVEEELKDLAKKPKTKLKIAFEVNGKMKGTSISEGGDVDILFSPRQEVMYVDFSETSKAKIELIKTSLKKTFGTFAKDDGTKDSSSHRIKLGEKGAAKNNRDKGRGVFIKQPDIFQLRYMKGASEHPFLNKFLPMHLTDMKINYAASGTYSTFYDGTPSHMSVSCSFQEVNPVYQEDYAEAGEGVGY